MSGISTGVFRQFSDFSRGGGAGYDTETLPLSAIDPHPDNRPIDRDKVEKLADTISRDGLGQLPLVRAMPNGRYQMISGHHRLEAYRLLARRTGEPRWKTVPVNVIRECDDDRALCLLHMTNLVIPDLSREEVGRAYEAIAAAVKREREAHPEQFAGVLTDTVVAQISTEQGRPAGKTYVRKARKAYRDSIAQASGSAAKSKPALARPSEADLAADALHRSIERLEALDPDELARVSPRLARYARRLRSLAREGAK